MFFSKLFKNFHPIPVLQNAPICPLQVQQPDLGTPGSGDVDDWDDKAALMVKQVALDDGDNDVDDNDDAQDNKDLLMVKQVAFDDGDDWL